MPAIVLIGPSDALAALRAQIPEESPLQTFTDHQIREAVEFIASHKPAIVAVEEGFAVSPRGEALVGRIMDDPSLVACEIRILSPGTRADRDRSRKKSGAGLTPAPAAAAPSVGEPPAAVPVIDRRGTRRVERIRILGGVAVTVDGNPAELVDLSPVGAQVVSRIILRPNQRVRVQLPEAKPDGRRALRCSASVVWASFEMPAGQPPRYRAGLKLSGVEADALHHFALRHRASISDETD